jgi:hypothetical protein
VGRRIEYKLQPRSEWELWAQHMGTPREVRASALSLKRDLRERYSRAQVRIDGKTLREEGGENDP